MLSKSRDYYEFGATARKQNSDPVKIVSVPKAKQKRPGNIRTKLRMLLFTISVFSCAMLLMYRYALITDLSYKIGEMKKEYHTIKTENLNIKVKIENSLDLAKVREMAEGQYGMHKPQREQIVSISVPKSDFIKTNENLNTKNTTGSNMFITGYLKIAKFVGLIK